MLGQLSVKEKTKEPNAKLSGNVAQSPSAVLNLLYFQCFLFLLTTFIFAFFCGKNFCFFYRERLRLLETAMAKVQVVSRESFGYGFVPEEFLPPGCDEYSLRNSQSPHPPNHWRHLKPDEIERLIRNANTSANWDDVLVTDEFNPRYITNSEFAGLVRIGRVGEVSLSHHDLIVPVGITNSRVVSCDIGDNVAVHNVRYLSHYIVSDRVMLLNIDEMHTSNYAKFGNGFVKDGEDESVRITMDLGNEAGGRDVLPFDSMTPGDAFLWSRFRDDDALVQKLAELTQNRFDSKRGYYGTVAQGCVVKNCRIVKDVIFGPAAYVKGANKLKNLTIDSTEQAPTQIGEGVELVNGIISAGCHIFYGCKAVRFVMGPCSNLKYGARLIHSYLGDNSTVSCCEILNNLIFPAHEQHHNNSFLTASCLMGQSNIAAGATIGSNHNSRANDGEILAGRGFWPGLCTTLKHSCKFASFVLLAKADYPAELNIPLPFSLLSNDQANDRLLVMPAYWWQYDMYALMRNSWKFHSRDNRHAPTQHIEFDFLAPDTVEEIFQARRLLEIWTAKAHCKQQGQAEELTDDALAQMGQKLLADKPEVVDALTILGEDMENSRRAVVILKARQAWEAYRQMLVYYAVKNLLDWQGKKSEIQNPKSEMAGELGAPRAKNWVNLGGQLMTRASFDELREDIKAGNLADWDAIHKACDKYWLEYPQAKQRHAFATLLAIFGDAEFSPELWNDALDQARDAQRFICEQTYQTRLKDFKNPFRQTTFRNAQEMTAVVGTIDDNSFVKQVRQETEDFEKKIERGRQ